MRDHCGHAKIERVAVLDTYRGTGIGALIMRELQELAMAGGYKVLELHAQVQVVGFYEKLGYISVGERFQEAGIWHQSMSRPLLG